MASKLADPKVTNDPLSKRWDPLGGLYVISSLIQVFMYRDGLIDLTLFTETRSFCLFFGPRVNSSREEAADGSSTHCRAEGAAVHSSVKRKRKKIGDFFIWNHFLNTVSLFDSWRSRG